MLLSTKPFRYVEWSGFSVHSRLLSYLTTTLTWIYHSSDDKNDREDIQWEIDIISVENVVTLLGKSLLGKSDEILAKWIVLPDKKFRPTKFRPAA